MKVYAAPWLPAVFLCGMWALALPAHAVTLVFTSIDLTDVIPGQDLWRYDYQVSGSFEPFGGLNLLFDSAQYQTLSDALPAASSDWDVFLVQPNPALPAPGLFTATRLVAPAALNDALSVNFVWLGNGAPGAQPYEVFDASFDVIERGLTQAVPEPHTYALYALGLLMLARRLSRPIA